MVRVIYSDASLAVGEIGRFFVAVWRGDVTRQRFEKQRWGLTEVVQRHPRGIGFLCVIEPSSKPPDSELRRASVEMVEEHGDRLRCVGLVIEGTGFATALVRAGISSMLLLHRKRSPLADFASVTSAVGWMSQYVPVDAGTDLVALVEELRAAMGGSAIRVR
jgi:hypothetical protein